MKALIVDPSRTYQQLLTAAIELAGFEVTQVSEGSKALELLRQDSFDLVCIAMYLEDMDGFMFSSHLRADTRTRQLPLIMITSNEDKESLNNAIILGVTEVFSKDEIEKITKYAKQFSLSRGFNDKMDGRILYIEDSMVIAGITSKLLTSHGFVIDHFVTGEQGVSAFHKNTYDLVLTDIILESKMSGYGVVRAIRNFQDERSRTPILAFSGFDDEARKIELLRSGANDYVTKPVLHEELLARVNNLITSKRLMDQTIAQQNYMRELAMKDQLTGLYNRHFLVEVAPSKINESLRHDIPCSLILLDVDHFKSINDNYGHATGDIVLKEVANILIDSTREEDVAARFGGEEFLLMLSHCDAASAYAKAEDIRKKIENLNPSNINVTASFGVVEGQRNTKEDFSDLFKAADKAVYHAKSIGRNTVVAYSELDLANTENSQSKDEVKSQVVI